MKTPTNILLLLVITFIPNLVFAQTSLQKLLTNIPIFTIKVLIPFLFGITFLIFVYNVLRFFIIEGNNEKGREKAKAIAIYSVAAFVFLIVFYGIVQILVNSTGLQNEDQPCPDYIEKSDPTKCPGRSA